MYPMRAFLRTAPLTPSVVAGIVTYVVGVFTSKIYTANFGTRTDATYKRREAAVVSCRMRHAVGLRKRRQIVTRNFRHAFVCARARKFAGCSFGAFSRRRTAADGSIVFINTLVC